MEKENSVEHRSDIVATHFRLIKPCGNCPFRKEGAIDLESGRLQGIVNHLVHDDHSTFHCHVTVVGKTGGEWDEEGQYTASGNEAMCAGAMIYLEKLGRPTVGMRLGRLWGRYQPRAMLAHHDLIMEPDKSAFQPSRKTQVKVRKHDAKTV